MRMCVIIYGSGLALQGPADQALEAASIHDILGDPEVTANILHITQPSQYRYEKLQYSFAVTSGSLSIMIFFYVTFTLRT